MAGWQQVKISRKRSSGKSMKASSSMSLGGMPANSVSYVSESILSRRVRSLRTASISLRCAAVTIQAAGLSGTPLTGQEASAEANDSCMASSARSKEPEMRIRLEMIRPDSCRKTDSATERISCMLRAGDGRGLGCRARAQPRHRPNFDTPSASLASGRDLGRPLDRFIEILAIDDVISSELLFGFGERPVHDQGLAVLHANRGRGHDRRERFDAPQDALPGRFFHYGAMAFPDLLALFRGRAVWREFGIDQHHVAHCRLLS